MYLGCLDWFFLYAERNFNSILNFAYTPLFKWLYASGIDFDYRFILAGVNIRTIFTKLTLYYSGLRLLAIPLVTLLICRILGTSELVTGVSVLLAGMPAGSTTAILAEKYDGDAVYASGCIFVSTLLSLLTIPALSVLMQVI